MTSQLVTALHDLAQKRPELLRPIARQTFFWPGFISRKRAFDRENAKLMDKIELGVGGPYSTKQWRISAASTQLAIKLHLLCHTYEKQWQLPPLTKKAKPIWFEKAWNYMVNDYGVVPEQDPHLTRLGRAAITRNINASAEDKRAEIRKQVWKTFDGLIASDPETE
jgi:hypothetical protein